MKLSQFQSRVIAVFSLGAVFVVTMIMSRRSDPMTDESEDDQFVYSLDEEKYDAYSFCNKREDASNWKDLYIEPEAVRTNDSFLPSKLEEAPVGFAPSTPKEFLREEVAFCWKRPKLKAIAIVHSAIKNVGRRTITRQTWGSASEELGVIFVMGRASNEDEQEIIDNESELYHDIVQGNFTDHYKFLIYSSLNAFYWMTKNCKHINWVIKADDDSMLDVKKYLYFLATFNKTTKFSEKIFCELECNKQVARNGTKFAVSEKEYPYSHYPIYCHGNMWLTSIDVLKSLLNVAPQVKFTWIDDIYVTGIMALKANIQRYRIKIPRSSFSPEEVGKVMAWRQIYSQRLNLWKSIQKYYNHHYPSLLGDDLSFGGRVPGNQSTKTIR